jgi:hypothetical protein
VRLADKPFGGVKPLVSIPDFSVDDPYVYAVAARSRVYLVVLRNIMDPSGLNYLKSESLPIQPVRNSEPDLHMILSSNHHDY